MFDTSFTRAYLRDNRSSVGFSLLLGGAVALCEALFLLVLRDIIASADSLTDSTTILSGLFGSVVLLSLVVTLRLLFSVAQLRIESSTIHKWLLSQENRLFHLLTTKIFPLYRELHRNALDQALSSIHGAQAPLFSLYRFYSAVLHLLLFLPLLIFLSPEISLTLLVVAPLVYLLSRKRIAVLKRVEERRTTAKVERESAQEGLLSRSEFWLGNGRLREQSERYRGISKSALHRDRMRTVSVQLLPSLMESLFFLLFAGLTWILSLVGAIPNSGFSASVLYFVALLLAYKPVREIARHYPEMQAGMSEWEFFTRLQLELERRPNQQAFLFHRSPSITLRGLGFAYERTPLFDALDLQIPFPSRCLINGPNGAGKTTLLRLLSGVEVPQRGEIWFPESLKRNERPDVTFLPQFGEPIDGELAMVRREVERAESVWLDLVSLLELSPILLKDSVNQLSGGQKQRLRLAQLFLHPAALLLLDEPTSWLPAPRRTPVLVGILDLWSQRVPASTIVVVSHEENISHHFTDAIALSSGNQCYHKSHPREAFWR